MHRYNRLLALLKKCREYVPPHLLQEIQATLKAKSGMPRKIDRKGVKRLAKTMSVADIAKRLKVTRQAVYRALKETK